MRLLALLVLVAACYAAFPDWRIALAVTLGCGAGLLLAVPRYGFTLAAVLLCPIALLAFLVSTLGWTADGPITALLSALGPASVLSLLPYAAARLSRRGLFVAIAAWVAGLVITVLAAQSIATRLVERTVDPMTSFGEQSVVAASYASEWTTFNSRGLTVHDDFRGQLDMAACDGLYSYRYVVSIPPGASREIERYISQPFRGFLANWLSGPDSTDPYISCTTSINDMPDGAIQLHGVCTPRNRAILYARQHYPLRTGFDIRLPVIGMAPPLIPGPGSRLTISAPANCIAGTFPEAASAQTVAGAERMMLDVGFPRGPALSEAEQAVSPPYLVHVRLLEPGRRHPARAVPARALGSRTGLVLLFVASAIAAALVAWPAWRWLLRCISATRSVPASGRWMLRTPRSGGRRGFLIRGLRLALGIALAGLALFVLLPVLQIVSVLALSDPTYGPPLLLFAGSLGMIELTAFAVRRRVPEPNDAGPAPVDGAGPAAESASSPIGDRPSRAGVDRKRAIMVAGLILAAAAMAYTVQRGRRPAPPPPAPAAPAAPAVPAVPAPAARASPGPIAACTHFDAMVTPLRAGAGRHAQFRLGATDVAGTIDFPAGGIVSDGKSAARVSLAAPVAMIPGMAFTLRERGTILGSGLAIGCNENRTAAMDIGTRVAWIVALRLGVEPRRITMNTRFAEDLGAQPLDTMVLMMALEEQFAVEIPDDVADRMLTVGDVTRYIRQNAA